MVEELRGKDSSLIPSLVLNWASIWPNFTFGPLCGHSRPIWAHRGYFPPNLYKVERGSSRDGLF